MKTTTLSKTRRLTKSLEDKIQQNVSKPYLAASGAFGLAGIATGAYLGYCQARGMSVPHDTQMFCTYWPTVAGTGLLAGGTLVKGFAQGLAGQATEKEVIKEGAKNTAITASMTGVGTLIGYLTGYSAGTLLG